MRNVLLYFSLSLLADISPSPGFAQDISFTRIPPPTNYPYSLISGMVQDSLGYMWFTSGPVLYRYDGYEFTTYTKDPSNPNSLSAKTLDCIFIDKSGFIWAGDIFNGLFMLDPATGKFTNYRHHPGDSSSIIFDHVSAITEDDQHNLWVGGPNGLSVLNRKSGKFKRYTHNAKDSTSLSSNDIITIYKDRSGTMWVCTGSAFIHQGVRDYNGGLNRFDAGSGKFTRYVRNPHNNESLADERVQTVFEDSRGTFWVGTTGKDGLYTLNRKTGKFSRYIYDPAHPSKLSRLPLQEVPPYVDDHVTFIQEDVTGAIWIGTYAAGLTRYDPKTNSVTRYRSSNDPDSLHEKGVWSVYASNDGILWIGSWEMGKFNLYKVDPEPNKFDRYNLGTVSAFCEDGSGRLYLGGNGLYVLDKNKKIVKSFFRDQNDSASLSDNYIQNMIIDKSGKLLLGTWEGGLNIFDPRTEKFKSYRHNPLDKNTLDSGNITSLLENSQGELWVGSVNGINVMNRATGTFSHIRHDPGDPNSIGGNSISVIFEDRSATTWIGVSKYGGLGMLRPGTRNFKRYLEGLSVLSIHEDSRNVLWVGTDDGLYWKSNQSGEFIRYIDFNFRKEPMHVMNIMEDAAENLWVTTFAGVHMIYPDRNESGFISLTVTWSIVYLPGFKSRSGELLYGSPNGFYHFFPEVFSRKTTKPQIVVQSLTILDSKGDNIRLMSSPDEKATIMLNYDQSTFAVNFAGINFKKPGQNQHMYMLEGYHRSWRKAGSERIASFYHVPPGNYILRLAASNSNGAWSQKSFRIIISPPWWNTWWFRTAAALAVLAMFYSGIRWRTHQKFRSQLERAEKDKQLADLRHKTSELEIHALRAQMNPHFIFNSLNSINRFILQNNRAQASEHLTKFSKLVRLVFHNSQEAVIPLENELEALRLYLELEALRFENQFTYIITVGDEVDASALKVPPLIIQPYTENAIWHGLMHKEAKGHLEIDILLEDEVLVCKIKDDGIGRKRSAQIKNKSRNTHKSMGMRITADRIALLRQQKQIQTVIQINDLTLPDGSAGGTEVIIKLPALYD